MQRWLAATARWVSYRDGRLPADTGHPFSLSDIPTESRLRVTVQACGDGSARVAHLRSGARVAIEGPYGTLDELECLASRSGIRVVHLPGARRADDSWLPAGYSGTDEDALTELAPAIAHSDIYLCGPHAWLAAAKRAARRAGAGRHQLHSEEFAW